MKILTRYLLKEFSIPFLISVIGFSVVVLIVQIFNDIRFIMDNKPGVLLTLKYFALQVPGFAVQIIPIAVLFGVLFSLSRLAKNSELIAMRAGGVSIYFVAIPLTIAGFVICLFTILMNEIVVPQTTLMTQHTHNVEIEHRSEEYANLQRPGISMMGANNQLYHIGLFNGTDNSMTDILILDYDNGAHLRSRIDAQSAKYLNNQWVFYNGYVRAFDDNDKEISAQPFAQLPVSIPEKPADFLQDPKPPEDRTLLELFRYVQQLEKNGSDCHRELVEFNHKLAIPFGCVILAILGVPWGWSMGKYSGVVASFGICLLVAFIYIGGQQIGQGLGNQGLMSPFIATWFMNMLFCVIGPILLIRKNR